MADLPTTMRAAIQTAPGKASIEQVPLPQIEFGSILVKVETVWIHSNGRVIFNASLPLFHLPYPIIPGTSNAIGRVAKVGPDTTTLQQGQLVLLNTFIRARDDPTVQILWGAYQGMTPQAKHLYVSTARNSVWAEYVAAPLENVYALNEKLLLGDPKTRGLGYKIQDLLLLAPTTVLYASLRSINLQSGERIIVSPATGQFSAAAVDVAVAMGANVIASSRNAIELAKLKAMHPRIETVALTGDLETDSKALAAFGTVDAVLDVGPPKATGSNSLAAAVSTLKPYGRISLSGGRTDESIPISYMAAMINNWTIRGQFMFERADQLGVIRLAECGLLKLGEESGHHVVATYGLESYEEAMDKAVEMSGPGNIVCLEP